MRAIKVFLTLALSGFVLAPSLGGIEGSLQAPVYPTTSVSRAAGGVFGSRGTPPLPGIPGLTRSAELSAAGGTKQSWLPDNSYGTQPFGSRLLYQLTHLEFTNRGRSVNDDPPTVDLESLQGYLDPAPDGLDVRYAWTLAGGKGENVKIIDIEFDWNLNHQDLVSAASHLFVYQPAADGDPTDDIPHGTAVLGELVAADDGFGVTGIANMAQIGLIDPAVSNTTLKLADAINRAAALLDPGDVMLIEQQMVGPRYNPMTGDGLIPNEFDATVYSAIKAATNSGIIVIEPASNGAENLDDNIYSGAFDRRVRDSGAIMVGAGFPPQSHQKADRSAVGESDYGSRLDVQGWGRGITTCGFGDVQLGSGANFAYTTVFGGTSGAAAMIAGAAAVLESIAKAQGQSPLAPLALRQLLAVTGSAQQGDLSRNIGPRPDLRSAIAALNSNLAAITPMIASASYNASNGKLTVNGSNFVPGNAVIEINGARLPRVKYPLGSIQPDGTTGRLVTKGDISAFVSPGTEVQMTVFNPGTGLRSPAVSFTP